MCDLLMALFKILLTFKTFSDIFWDDLLSFFTFIFKLFQYLTWYDIFFFFFKNDIFIFFVGRVRTHISAPSVACSSQRPLVPNYYAVSTTIELFLCVNTLNSWLCFCSAHAASSYTVCFFGFPQFSFSLSWKKKLRS